MNPRKLRRPEASIRDLAIFPAAGLKPALDKIEKPEYEKASFGMMLGGTSLSVGEYSFSFKSKNCMSAVIKIMRKSKEIATINVFFNEPESFKDAETDAMIKLTLLRPLAGGSGLSVNIAREE